MYPGGWRRGSSSSCSAECRAAARTGWPGPRRITPGTSRVSSCWGVVCTLCTVSPPLAAWFLLAQGRYGVPDVSTALTSPNVTSTSDTCFSFWFQIKVRLPRPRCPGHHQCPRAGGRRRGPALHLPAGGWPGAAAVVLHAQAGLLGGGPDTAAQK